MKKYYKPPEFITKFYFPVFLLLVVFGAQVFAINSYSKENFEYNKILKQKEELVKINNLLKEDIFKMGSLSYIEERAKEIGFEKSQMIFVKNPPLATIANVSN